MGNARHMTTPGPTCKIFNIELIIPCTSGSATLAITGYRTASYYPSGKLIE